MSAGKYLLVFISIPLFSVSVPAIRQRQGLKPEGTKVDGPLEICGPVDPQRLASERKERPLQILVDENYSAPTWHSSISNAIHEIPGAGGLALFSRGQPFARGLSFAIVGRSLDNPLRNHLM